MTVLNTLLEITIYSAVLFGAIWLFRILLKKQLSPMMLYAVWFILIARLLMPVTIASGFSLITIPAEEQPVAYSKSVDLSDMFDNTAVSTGSVPYNDMQTTQQQDALSQQSGQNTSVQSETILSSNSKLNITWQMALIALWLAGSAIMLIQIGISVLKLKKRIKTAHTIPTHWQRIAEELQTELGFKRSVRIVMIEGFPSPALCGGLKPVIVLPSEMAGKSQEPIRFALLHEMTHIKRGDHIVSMLLLLLRAVYWFNPIVWLMMKQMRLDIETACDSCLTKPMTKSTKKRYAGTMLSMYAQQQIRYVLGMSLGQTKKTAERRLRCMYMRSRTSRKGKMVAILLTTVLLVTCFTTACQPTPQEDVVVGKGDGLSDLIQATPDASSSVSPSSTSAQPNDALYTKLGAPKHWSLETTAHAEKLNITAEVDVELPGVSELPAATASLRAFTQEDLEKIADVLGVDDATWTERNLTKEQVEQWIMEVKQEIANTDDAIRLEKAKENLKAHEQWYNEVPYESELKNIEFEIGVVDSDQELIGFEGTTQVDDQPFFFLACNAYYSDVVNRVYANYGSGIIGFGGLDIDAPYGVSLTKEQAAEQASEIAAQLTDELTLCHITPAASGGDDMSRNWGWACVFMREINGCPTAYDRAERPSSLEAVNVPINYEKMVIVMDDSGVVSFKWDIPMTIESIDNPDVPLMSFDEISQRAIEQITHRYADTVGERINDRTGIDWGDPGCTADVVKVELGLMRIDKVNSDDYYYMPVWKFFVDTVHTDDYYERTGSEPLSSDTMADIEFRIENGYSLNASYEYVVGHYNVITLNALDGSVIDTMLGY